MKELNIDENENKPRKPRRGSIKNTENVESKKIQSEKPTPVRVQEPKPEKIKTEKVKEENIKPEKIKKEKYVAEKKPKANKKNAPEHEIETTNFAEEFKPKRRISKGKIAVIIIYLLLCIGVIYAGYFMGTKYALINITKLNKAELGINEHAFDEANTNLTRDQFNQIKTIAVFGTDNRSNDKEGARSDVNMVVSINPTTKSIKMISIPRDTHVQIKGSKDKMGHAYAYGGPTLAINTINQNFGLNITDYATIDFVGVINAINKLGGVEVEITEDERAYINERVHESYKMSKNTVVKVNSVGVVTLTGEQALTHSRNRTVGSDFARAERQRIILQAILKKLSTKNLGEIMDLIETMLKEVETNANVADYMKIVPSVFANKDDYLSNVISAQVPSMTNLSTQTINGISCVVPTSMTEAKTEFQDYIYNK